MDTAFPQTVQVEGGRVPTGPKCNPLNHLLPITKERPAGTAGITIDPVRNYERRLDLLPSHPLRLVHPSVFLASLDQLWDPSRWWPPSSSRSWWLFRNPTLPRGRQVSSNNRTPSPHPFTAQEQAAGYTYDLSILPAEFSLTQVLDRPQTGRILFEEIIRENLDLGRPDQIQLVFGRRVTRRTPGVSRTRVITRNMTPSLHFYDKRTHIRQYHKEGRALRTETTINDTRDFRIGKRLKNLPGLREIGFQANRRLLDVQRVSHDCRIGEDAFQRVARPVVVQDQRVPALRFDDDRVQQLLAALVVFRLLPDGYTNGDLREHLAPLLGLDPSHITPGWMTYDLRRLRLHGLIEGIPGQHRYRLTGLGLRTALFFTRACARIVRPGLTQVLDAPPGTWLPTSPADFLTVPMPCYGESATMGFA